jgi:hypothetical protein
MENRRRFLRLEVNDFLEMSPVGEVAKTFKGQTKNFSPLGICFSSEIEWRRGQVILIDYFIPEEFDSVKLKVVAVWSEFIDPENGYFCGAEIIEIEQKKQEKFTAYYFKKIKETSHE